MQYASIDINNRLSGIFDDDMIPPKTIPDPSYKLSATEQLTLEPLIPNPNYDSTKPSTTKIANDITIPNPNYDPTQPTTFRGNNVKTLRNYAYDKTKPSVVTGTNTAVITNPTYDGTKTAISYAPIINNPNTIVPLVVMPIDATDVQKSLSGTQLEYVSATKTWIEYIPQPPTAAELLAKEQATKNSEIETVYAASSVVPVVVAGVTYDGGYSSAMKYDAGKRLAALAGLPTVDFFDTAHVAHTLTIADAVVVILTVGADYQTKFIKYKDYLVQVSNATTISAVKAIVVTI